jgi:MinD superfamily P-loop ATPase
MGDDRVKGFAADEGIPVIMEIPFDRKIAESYSRGELIAESIPEYKK